MYVCTCTCDQEHSINIVCVFPLVLAHMYRWKQLFYVAVFYLFFIYMYALLGVQWIGGLDKRCVYAPNDTDGDMSVSIVCLFF